MEFLYQIACSFHGSAGCKEVVVEEYDVVFIDGIFVDFDGVDTIFLSITFLYGFAW